MALKRRETTRRAARVGTWISTSISLIFEALKSFLDFKNEDKLLTKGKKTADLVARQITYLAVDNYLFGLSAAIFVAMKTLEFSFFWTFLTLWAFDFTVAAVFIVLYEKTGEDLSLGEDFRRAADTIRKKSQLANYAVLLFVIVKAIFWTGPEKIITFFRKEIGTIARVVVALFILTAIQAFIWTILYGFGYGLVIGS